jgi:hypothetical protein
VKAEVVRRLDQLFMSTPVLAGGVVPPEEIEAAERLVGMKFDDDYREFLERYGGAMVGSVPILGLRHAEVMGDETVVEVTSRFRAQGWKPTEDWVVISVDLGGNPIGLSAKGEVWVSDHDFGGTAMLFTTFNEFVEALLTSGTPYLR